ncbi:MAG TPA: D-alanine--D-alanine ligase [Deltaproteobacteria bacterium]|nr:MAG: hypothetical protein A2048_00515 [Deltaproteobacteria bacterium GWA2_45_12]HBF11937.1 D-alanine--D-alanine ligase [Deltaproteobacteria bacterium]
MKIAVLKGGISKEREISLRSGGAVALALKRKGHDVGEFDPQSPHFVKDLLAFNPQKVFLALHGKGGEDGTMQGFLQTVGLPYAGCGVLTSAICFDKVATKEFLGSHQIPMPKQAVFSRGQDVAWFVQTFPLPFPVIVKPNTEGSTIGVSRVFKKEELAGALEVALAFDSIILVEEYIQGREVTVGVVNGQALPVVEVVPKSGFYDFTSKYTKGQTEYKVPAPIDEVLTKELHVLSEKINRVLGCSGGVRIDFMLQNGNPLFLEVNTIPGMTETSLLPKAAACVGVSFEDLCEKILEG